MAQVGCHLLLLHLLLLRCQLRRLLCLLLLLCLNRLLLYLLLPLCSLA